MPNPLSDTAEMPADAIEVGRIGEAWGVKGWFKVVPHSAQAEALFSSKRWYLQAHGQQPVRLLSVREARTHSDTVVASAQEVPDRTAAEALRGSRIFISRASFPSVATDEFYWVDLIGLQVANREGVALGQVRELLSAGPQTTLVLDALGEDGQPTERLIPFVAAFVDAVDLPGRTITVDWQADY